MAGRVLPYASPDELHGCTLDLGHGPVSVRSHSLHRLMLQGHWCSSDIVFKRFSIDVHVEGATALMCMLRVQQHTKLRVQQQAAVVRKLWAHAQCALSVVCQL